MEPTQKGFALSALVLLAAAWWSAQSAAAEEPVWTAGCLDACPMSPRISNDAPARTD